MRSALIIVLACSLLLGAALRAVYVSETPRDLDEMHYGVDALWSHPSFPAPRLAFLRGHPRPHRVLDLRSWELVEHGTAGTHGWRLTRVGHTTLHTGLLGALARPFYDREAPSAGDETRRLLWLFRGVGMLLDLAVLGLLVLCVHRLWGPWAAGGSGAIYALAPWIAGPAVQVRPDALLALCLVGAALLLHAARERPHTDRRVFLAGALLGLAVATKQSAPLFFPLVLLGGLGSPRLFTRVALMGGVGVVVALALTDLGGALAWMNRREDTRTTGFPPDVLRNLLALAHPNGWWMLGDSFALGIATPLARLHLFLTPWVVGALGGALALAFSGPRWRQALVVFGAALLPSLLVPHTAAVYRLLPAAWVLGLLGGLGAAELPRASRRRLVGAALMAVVLGGVLTLSCQRASRYGEFYRLANQAFDREFAGGRRGLGQRALGQAWLDAARSVDPDAAPALILEAKVRWAEGDRPRARELALRARQDPWLRALPPMFLPHGTPTVLSWAKQGGD